LPLSCMLKLGSTYLPFLEPAPFTSTPPLCKWLYMGSPHLLFLRTSTRNSPLTILAMFWPSHYTGSPKLSNGRRNVPPLFGSLSSETKPKMLPVAPTSSLFPPPCKLNASYASANPLSVQDARDLATTLPNSNTLRAAARAQVPTPLVHTPAPPTPALQKVAPVPTP